MTDSTPAKPDRIRSPQFVNVYANHVIFGASYFDMTLIFGELTRTLDGDTITEERASVSMSWPQAKLLATYIAANVMAHELFNGTIKIPKEFFAPTEVSGDLAMGQMIEKMGEAVRADKLRTTVPKIAAGPAKPHK